MMNGIGVVNGMFFGVFCGVVMENMFGVGLML